MRAKSPVTITDRLRQLTAPPLDRAGQVLANLGIHPNLVTLSGTLLVGIAALQLARGRFLAGGVLLLISLPLDALDGAVARAAGGGSRFGMVFDSAMDRYADAFIFAGFGYYFAERGRLDFLLCALAALCGSYMVSYLRARADDAKVAVSVTVGWFSRLERVAVILIMTFAAAWLGDARPLEIGLIALALGTNFTALQRLLYARKTLKNRGD